MHLTSRLVYTCGSLFTSIMPCLALRGVGTAIATSPSLKYRVLLLNSRFDRETPSGYTASDFVEAVRATCSESFGGHDAPQLEARELVSHVVYIKSGEMPVDEEALEVRAIR